MPRIASITNRGLSRVGLKRILPEFFYPLSNSGPSDPTNFFWRLTQAPVGYRYVEGEGIYTNQPLTSMLGMFADRQTFNDPDIALWDTSTVTIMNQAFQWAFAFNQDIGGWDVSNVTQMRFVFSGDQSFGILGEFNQDIGGWDVSNVTNMGNMFSYSKFNQNIGGWNTSAVTDMNNMFNGAEEFNQDIGGWDVSNVTNMDQMFVRVAQFNQDLTGWCVSNIPTQPSFFAFASAFDPSNHPVWGTCPSIPSIDFNVDFGPFEMSPVEGGPFGGGNAISTGIISVYVDVLSGSVDDIPTGSYEGFIPVQQGNNTATAELFSYTSQILPGNQVIIDSDLLNYQGDAIDGELPFTLWFGTPV